MAGLPLTIRIAHGGLLYGDDEKTRRAFEAAMKLRTQLEREPDPQFVIVSPDMKKRMDREITQQQEANMTHGTVAAHTREEEREERRAARISRSIARRARWRSWWRGVTKREQRPPVPAAMKAWSASDVENLRRCADMLYESRILTSGGTHPYASRAFWGALGLSLGKDISWITTTAIDPEDSRLVLQAAHKLYTEACA